METNYLVMMAVVTLVPAASHEVVVVVVVVVAAAMVQRVIFHFQSDPMFVCIIHIVTCPSYMISSSSYGLIKSDTVTSSCSSSDFDRP